MGYEDMFNPEYRDYVKSQKPTKRQREIAKLEASADDGHNLSAGEPRLTFVEVKAIFESQKALRLRLESVEEKLDRLLELREERP